MLIFGHMDISLFAESYYFFVCLLVKHEEQIIIDFDRESVSLCAFFYF